MRPLSQAEIISRVTRQLQKLEMKRDSSLHPTKIFNSRVSSPSRRSKVRA
ncbi:unnamed protein product [Trichobilharzia regenti]|nr:unnamed protein product [Trichobilharzia regenti]